MTTITMDYLRLTNIITTPTILELDNTSRAIPVGIMQEVMVSLDSWEYLVYFVVVQHKSSLGC